MKFKIKFTCGYCGKKFYFGASCKSRKDATRFKNRFKNDKDGFLHAVSDDYLNCRKEVQ